MGRNAFLFGVVMLAACSGAGTVQTSGGTGGSGGAGGGSALENGSGGAGGGSACVYGIDPGACGCCLDGAAVTCPPNTIGAPDGGGVLTLPICKPR